MGLARLIEMCLNEMYSEVCMDKSISGTLAIQNDLKQSDALSSLLFTFPLEYATRMIQENWVEVKWLTSAAGLCLCYLIM
jgi:hypothetical protein